MQRISANVREWDTWSAEHRRSVIEARIEEVEAASGRSSSQYPAPPPEISEEAVARLPHGRNDRMGVECSICLAPMVVGCSIIALQCDDPPHIFHRKCIKRWLTTRFGNCPMCKRAVPT